MFGVWTNNISTAEGCLAPGKEKLGEPASTMYSLLYLALEAHEGDGVY